MSATVTPLRSFELRALARAFLLRECVFASFVEAFDPLWADVERDDLVAQYGLQTLMDIIIAACDSVGVRTDVDDRG
jgi:hypothetical protein